MSTPVIPSVPRERTAGRALAVVLALLIELEVSPALRHYGIGPIPWSPLGGACSAAC
ncbi:hypothetical protein [Streptomyces sp. Ru62]|uniref:hypothetical protein n=1 Tax=Streptomyces sp. Ru62 TaxID=2080745 RepID=UPI0021566656|nr:hypothetical protein [Streptomyces sp. Ru62]